jgi:hypothetical protein
MKLRGIRWRFARDDRNLDRGGRLRGYWPEETEVAARESEHC